MLASFRARLADRSTFGRIFAKRRKSESETATWLVV